RGRTDQRLDVEALELLRGELPAAPRLQPRTQCAVLVQRRGEALGDEHREALALVVLLRPLTAEEVDADLVLHLGHALPRLLDQPLVIHVHAHGAEAALGVRRVVGRAAAAFCQDDCHWLPPSFNEFQVHYFDCMPQQCGLCCAALFAAHVFTTNTAAPPPSPPPSG